MLSFRSMLLALVAAAMAVAGFLSWTALRGLGDLEASASQVYVAKDVTADILPPPLYLIEARLVASQALEGYLDAASAQRELARLKAEYDARAAHWSAEPPYGLERELLGPQHAAAQRLLSTLTGPSDFVIVDEPAVAFQARRLVPPNLVDTSMVRIRSRSLDADDVIRAAQQSDVRVLFLFSDGLRNLKPFAAWVDDQFVTVKINDGVYSATASGNGPMNALDMALRQCLANVYPSIQSVRLTDYKVRVIDSKKGTAAKVRVHVEWSDQQRSWATVGVSENVIEASWKALEDAIQLELMRMNQKDTLIEKAVEDYSWGV